jgi:hypothetical protein
VVAGNFFPKLLGNLFLLFQLRCFVGVLILQLPNPMFFRLQLADPFLVRLLDCSLGGSLLPKCLILLHDTLGQKLDLRYEFGVVSLQCYILRFLLCQLLFFLKCISDQSLTVFGHGPILMNKVVG